MAPVKLLSPPVKAPEAVSEEFILHQLGPAMARIAAETSGAFLMSEAVPATDCTVVPRLPDLGILRCSQKNIGEKREMALSLAVDKAEWDRLFAGGEAEDFRVDAFCEMCNCACGGILADAAFTDAFGYLIPCVPHTGPAKAPLSARSYRAAFRIGGAWVHMTLSVGDASGILSPSQTMVA